MLIMTWNNENDILRPFLKVIFKNVEEWIASNYFVFVFFHFYKILLFSFCIFLYYGSLSVVAQDFRRKHFGKKFYLIIFQNIFLEYFLVGLNFFFKFIF